MFRVKGSLVEGENNHVSQVMSLVQTVKEEGWFETI